MPGSQGDGHRAAMRHPDDPSEPVDPELPAQLRDATAKRYPEFFDPPALSDWGKPNDSTWGTFMKECRPKPPR